MIANLGKYFCFDWGTIAQIMNPKNCQTVQLRFKGEKVARAVGSLVTQAPKEGNRVSGLLVKKGFALQVSHTLQPPNCAGILPQTLNPYPNPEP